MKSNRKTKTIILIILGIFFAFLPIIINNPRFTSRDRDITSNYNDEFVHNYLKISAVSGKIHLDGNSGWAVFKAAGNCTGNGTYSEPYVIEDLVIDGGGSGSCIWIQNSDVYFRIEDCTLYNAGTGYAGIELQNVINSQLIDNDASNNEENGIELYNSHNNTLSGNDATSNLNGIVLFHSDNNLISENNANSNTYLGIYLHQSYNNSVTQNMMRANLSTGLYIPDTGPDTSYGNSIFLNCFINNDLNAHDDGLNDWDNDVKGNYWSDYTGSDANGDGIGDIPYDNITGNAGSQDNFPLMKCPISAQDGGGVPIELIILISVIGGGAVIGVASILLIRRKRKTIE